MSKNPFINLLDVPVYYINLDEDFEKRQSTEKLLISMGFGSITRISAINKKSSKFLSVTLSHIKAIKSAVEKSGFPFLIVEDDITLKNNKISFEAPENLDALYLGVSKWGFYNGKGLLQLSIEEYNDDLHRVYNMLAAHAIVYFSKDYVQALLKSYEFFIKIAGAHDFANAELMKYYKVYAVSNPIFYQSGYNEVNTNFMLSEAISYDSHSAFTFR
jgi:hypothetical protein